MAVKPTRNKFPEDVIIGDFLFTKGEWQRCLCSQGLGFSGRFLFPGNGAESVRGSRNLANLEIIALVSQNELNPHNVRY